MPFNGKSSPANVLVANHAKQAASIDSGGQPRHAVEIIFLPACTIILSIR